jgi:hypothetical protein
MMQGAPLLRNSMSFLPGTIRRPLTQIVFRQTTLFESLKQDEHTWILPPALVKLAINSFSGGNSC